MALPSVCVVIPAHNSQATLRRALESVAAQTLAPDKVIVVDDASTDATSQIALSFPGLKIELVRLDRNAGAAGARNQGVERAGTDLVAFLDADDEWLPTKLEKQVPLIQSKPLLAFVSCCSNLISPSGQDLGDIYRGQTVVVGPGSWKALLEDNFITTPSVLVWRHQLDAVGGFDESLKIAEDQDMWIRLAERGELGYVPECLVHVHERERSLSAGSFNDQLTCTLPMIERHLVRLATRLSAGEIKTIRGRRMLRLGQLAFVRGAPEAGQRLILRSIAIGYKPWEGIIFLVKASRAARWIRQNILRR